MGVALCILFFPDFSRSRSLYLALYYDFPLITTLTRSSTRSLRHVSTDSKNRPALRSSILSRSISDCGGTKVCQFITCQCAAQLEEQCCTMGSRSRIHLLLQYESGLCGATSA